MNPWGTPYQQGLLAFTVSRGSQQGSDSCVSVPPAELGPIPSTWHTRQGGSACQILRHWLHEPQKCSLSSLSIHSWLRDQGTYSSETLPGTVPHIRLHVYWPLLSLHLSSMHGDPLHTPPRAGTSVNSRAG